MKLRIVYSALIALIVSVSSAPVSADTQALTLTALEQQLPSDPALLAAELDVTAAQEQLLVERARDSWYFTYAGSIGPSPVIEPNGVAPSVVKLYQNAGIAVPLFGSRTVHDDAVLSAEERISTARIALLQLHRERLAALRAAYIKYWQYDTQAAIAQAYAHDNNSQLPRARALRRTGFWTSTNMLDFLDSVEKIKTDESNFTSSQRGQLAQVHFAIGSEIPAFHPVRPEFFDSCSVDRSSAVASATVADAALAQFAAQTAYVRAQLAQVPGSSIQGTASVVAGTLTNVSQAVSGYGIHASVNLSAPPHALVEERSLRAAYEAQLQALELQQTQRKVEIASAVDAVLDDIANAKSTLKQALSDQNARSQDERKAIIRFDTIKEPGAVSFADVFEKHEERYTADRASAEASANVMLGANALLLLAPDSCAAAPPVTISRSSKH